MPEMRIAGRRVTWREAGEGPPVVLAHCSLAHSGLWKPVMAELARDFRVMAVDMPAHGGSEPPPEGVSLQLHAVECCRALLAAAGAPGHLVGLSLGGAVLGRLALAEPERVASLTLIEPVWFHLLAEAGRPEYDDNLRFNGSITEAVRRGDLAAGARAFMEAWGMRGKYEAMDGEGRAYVAECLRHLAADFDMVDAFPPGQVRLEDVARLRPPVLLVSVERKPAPARAVIEVLHAALPAARREVIAGAGHLSPVSHPEAVAVLLGDFFAEAGA
ncbi:MAG TPA: alpha/beta fold hydrolase [Paracoccaceae bacterium]|nr:alpha/beta fold hydrolase [Paracoccaceae bacterium]